MAGTILVVDDEKLVRWSLRERLVQDGFRVVEAEDGARAQELFREGVDLALLDFRLPDTDGLKLLEAFKGIDPDVPVLIVTAHATVDNAVDAMRKGAFDYVTKPFNLEEMCVKVAKALETRLLRREVREVRRERKAAYGFDTFIGKDPKMEAILQIARTVARSPATTVLIQGESGTGKELIAKAIHYESPRARLPFMNITCAALTETILESELFGHERGAFTDAKDRKKGLLEQADGGTVFLDEIGDTSPAFQAKLLRFLEDRAFKRVGGTQDLSVNVRVIAATNQDLAVFVKERRFREDLYYRLRVVPIVMPPLRERPEDIPLLVEHFVARYSAEFRKQVKSIAPEALARLRAHPWPGNIRELRNVVERAMLFVTGDRLEEPHFFLEGAVVAKGIAGDWTLPASGVQIDDVERDLVEQALSRTGWNLTHAARLLGINRDQVRYRIEKFGLQRRAGV
jgi:DNA-binding NtrC family response regulator